MGLGKTVELLACILSNKFDQEGFTAGIQIQPESDPGSRSGPGYSREAVGPAPAAAPEVAGYDAAVSGVGPDQGGVAKRQRILSRRKISSDPSFAGNKEWMPPVPAPPVPAPVSFLFPVAGHGSPWARESRKKRGRETSPWPRKMVDLIGASVCTKGSELPCIDLWSV